MLQRGNGMIRVEYPPILRPVWHKHIRYKGIVGGRGSAKSHTAAARYVNLAANEHHRVACMREIQNSIKDSVKQLLEDKIRMYGLSDYFKITDKEISCPSTDSLFTFRGLQNHTATSIKSLEGYTDAWYEEAQTLSQKSLDLATPTFRSDSEQLFTWNRTDPEDPVDSFFVNGVNEVMPDGSIGDPDFLLVVCNWEHNPWFPDELRRDMERDRRRDIDKYNHVWGGHYRVNSEARVFKNVRSFHFDTPSDAFFLHGADFGFSVDPTVLVRCFTGHMADGAPVYDPEGKTLFIDFEAYEVGCEIDHTPSLFDMLDPDNPKNARKWEIRADSARPETISYIRRHDYPLIVRSTKGPNSVIEGITFLQDYDIVVHPRCKHTLDEFSFYSYKIDPKTGKITRELDEKKNHVIDSVRYAIEPLRKLPPIWHVGA